MRIAINCRSILLNQRTGIGRYTYHLLDSLGQIDADNEYVLHAPKGLFDFKRRLPDFSSYKNLKRYPDYFKRGVDHYDIYHYPCPDLVSSYTGKLVVTIHDLIYKTYPQAHTPQTIELTEKYMQSIVAQADFYICTSENTRRDLHAHFDIPPDQTCVVYSGVDHTVFRRLTDQERAQSATLLKELHIDRPYVLFVGTIEPRKNLAGLLKSFALLKSKKVFSGQLVVVGMKGWMVESISKAVQELGIENEVVFTGYISDEQLCRLYNLAQVYTFPTFYEGFGFPIVEAFACGTAVVTSKTSSCGEIAGDAGITIDPTDHKALAEALEQVLTDKNLRESLGRKGLKRAQEFNFLKTAQNTLNVYKKIKYGFANAA